MTKITSNQPSITNTLSSSEKSNDPKDHLVIDSFHFQDTIFKLFTYIIILLPTLTSILYPNNSQQSNISNNEQIGNLIIDLLTVLLISWVVRFTMEWPFNWLKQLNQTKNSLLNQISNKSLDIDDEQVYEKKILLIRKINTFEIIALLSCLISSIFSSCLLIWTRNYTIIDQKRKKMVFNNVNIALLQFWSIFRIIITFTNMLQFTSLNENQVFINQPSLKNWYSDLKYYFLPNTTNHLLLNHLQTYNKQFDKLKIDLKDLQNQLNENSMNNIVPPSSSFTPYPLNKSPIPSPTIDTHHFQFDPLPSQKIGFHPVSTPVSPSPSPSPLKTIMEEDDLVFEQNDRLSPPASFGKFDTTNGNLEKLIIKQLNLIYKTLFSQLTFADFVKNPSLVRIKLIECVSILNSLLYKINSYQLMKIMASEIANQISLNIYIPIISQIKDTINHPFRFVFNSTISLLLKLPFFITKTYIKVSLLIPVILFKLFIIKPLNLLSLIIFNIYSIIFTSKTNQQSKIIKPKKIQEDKFEMKKFHLSPVLPERPRVTSRTDFRSIHNNNNHRYKFRFNESERVKPTYSKLNRNFRYGYNE